MAKLRQRNWWAWYRLYLDSKTWRRLRARIIKARNRTCAQCGRQAHQVEIHMLQCHHLTYDRVGRERPGDLELLCVVCHKLRHTLFSPVV